MGDGDTVAFWTAKAEEVRAEAARTEDSFVRTELILLAEKYAQLAVMAATKPKQRPTAAWVLDPKATNPNPQAETGGTED